MHLKQKSCGMSCVLLNFLIILTFCIRHQICFNQENIQMTWLNWYIQRLQSYRMVEKKQAVTKSKKKTNFMVFRRSRRKIELKEDVIIDNVKIDFVTQTKFLGVILNQHLIFESHVQYTKGKIARGIGILYKAKKYLKESSMKTLYYAFIYPYFTYCITVWGNTFNSVLEPLIVLQKVAIRIVCGAQKFDHTYPLFQPCPLAVP